MHTRFYTIRLPKRWVRAALIVTVTTLVVAPLTAFATHSFNDVSNDHTFHNDIAWLAENNVTRGCNPPANTRYCPNDFVTRGEMSAFIRRLAQTFGVAGDQISDPLDATGSPEPVELLSITVAPKGEAEVVLNAHANVSIPDEVGETLVFLWIGRDGCVPEEGHEPLVDVTGITEGPGTDLLAVTAVDVVTSNTTYKLCTSGDGRPYTMHSRAVTATWTPTG